jgi:hypothetical protein
MDRKGPSRSAAGCPAMGGNGGGASDDGGRPGGHFAWGGRLSKMEKVVCDSDAGTDTG